MHADSDQTASMRASRRSLIGALALCTGTMLFIWQVRHPFFRFASGAVNDGVGLVAALTLPWWAVVEFLRVRRWWADAIAIIALLPLLVYSGVALLYSILERDGVERFSEVEWRGSRICLYRTNGGATTNVGVVIRQEKTILPGVRLVRRVGDYYPCADVDVAAAPGGITVGSGRYCPALSSPRDYPLRSFVYF